MTIGANCTTRQWIVLKRQKEKRGYTSGGFHTKQVQHGDLSPLLKGRNGPKTYAGLFHIKLMQAQWKRNELQQAEMGTLLFTSQQSRLMLAEARRRVTQ
jgi:hypothetical protein